MERTDRTTFLASLGALAAAGWSLRRLPLREFFTRRPEAPPPPPDPAPSLQITPPAHSVKRRG